MLQDADAAVKFQRICEAKEIMLNRPSIEGGYMGMGTGPGMPHRGAYADPDVEAMRRREEECVQQLRRQTEELVRQFSAWVAESDRQLREAWMRQRAEAQARQR